ncbi:MAG: hypothetical protein Kow00121_40940 [Elainellaceae cyanobacterium]
MSTSDVLRYIIRQYQRGEISQEELEIFTNHTITTAVRLQVEKTAKRVIRRQRYAFLR